jgi:hypothetical protein
MTIESAQGQQWKARPSGLRGRRRLRACPTYGAATSTGSDSLLSFWLLLTALTA